MQFGLRHRRLEAEQKAIVVLAGVVEAVFVDDQGLGQGTDLQQTIPVAGGAGEAGGFQAEDGAGLAQAHRGDQALEAIATGDRGPGAPLIPVDDGDVLLGPAEITGALDQVILASGAGGVVAHLGQRGLTDIDDGLTVEMVRPDFGGSGRRQHAGAPGSAPPSGWRPG
jgi:hypothetical protein